MVYVSQIAKSAPRASRRNRKYLTTNLSSFGKWRWKYLDDTLGQGFTMGERAAIVAWMKCSAPWKMCEDVSSVVDSRHLNLLPKIKTFFIVRLAPPFHNVATHRKSAQFIFSDSQKFFLQLIKVPIKTAAVWWLLCVFPLDLRNNK